MVVSVTRVTNVTQVLNYTPNKLCLLRMDCYTLWSLVELLTLLHLVNAETVIIFEQTLMILWHQKAA